MFERFTADARAVVVTAQAEAEALNHRLVGTEHLLLALITQDGPTAGLLHAAGVDHTTVRAAVTRHVGTHTAPGADTEEEDAAALRAIGIDLAAVRAAIEENFGAGALRLPPPAPRKRGLFGRRGGRHPFSDRAKKVLELSLREALRLGHNFIASEHIALGLLREGEGLAALILSEADVDFDSLRTGLTKALATKAA